MNIFTSLSKNIVAFIVVIVSFFILFLCSYSVHETQMAAIYAFGKPIKQVNNAGLHFKLPWPFQSVEYVSKKLQIYDSNPADILTVDKKTLTVDKFALYRIIDSMKFLTTIGTLEKAQSRIDDNVYSAMRSEMGKKTYHQIVNLEREEVLDSVTSLTSKSISDYGMDCALVRTNMVNLPERNEQAVFQRMITERENVAQQYLSEGEREAVKITSNADMEAGIIKSNAEMESLRIMGDAEASEIKIYNEAFGKDFEFYTFMKSMEAGEVAFDRADKTFVFTGKEEHLKYLFQN